MSTEGKKPRRGRGDDAIYWDKSKGSYVGEVSLGFTASGNRKRRKVYGKTKAEVRDRLKELHTEIETRYHLLSRIHRDRGGEKIA